MDLATILGLAVSFGLIVAAMILGGTPIAFFDIPAIFIVLGGTFGVTMVCFSLKEVFHAWSVIFKAVFSTTSDPSEVAAELLEISEQARQSGLLGLQEFMRNFEDNEFLHKGISLVVDGMPPDEAETILRREISAMTQRHHKSVGILRKAAEVAPAMGLIGTLVGLVQMLGNLDDPSSIGPAMAVALLTTFYGAILANMLFSPLAAKLERNSTEEALIRNLYVAGTISIGRQENPRRLEMILNSMLPPAHRVHYFD